ncbi:MAG: polysaccharide deacetylase family protein [Gracilimonas sp.]|nr:polysaccharide deacetylase family protein [Gracilimonas sp.]
MKRPLCIGIFDLTPAWRVFLDQVGVWYEEITTNKDLYENYSAIIVNKSINKEQLQDIRGYLKLAGNVIFVNDDHGSMPDKTFNRKYFKRVYNDLSLDGFQHIPYLDFYSTVKTTEKANLSGLLSFKKLMKGNAAYIGFDPAELLCHTDYTRKCFDSTVGAFPDEIVNKVTKGQVSDFFLQVLREIHFKADLPFIRKWISPKKAPVFCFRIDSDYSDKQHIDEVYSLIDDHKIKATWFLHVNAHESWLSHFKKYSDQEIALHGYKHGTSRSERKVTDNISVGLNKMSESGFNVTGFCAPYGIYNYALERSLNRFEFNYSSEFTYAYDSIPLKTSDGLLQIPIHPICTGSLNRKGYTTEEMLAYFNEIMVRKLDRHEPVIFYHHPLQPGLELFDSIFKRVKNEKLTNLTFEEFADFWQKREVCSFEAYYKGNSGQLENVSDKSQLFEVSFENGSSQLITSKESDFNIENNPDIQYNNNNSQFSENDTPDADFIGKLRLLKRSILDYRNRDRL